MYEKSGQEFEVLIFSPLALSGFAERRVWHEEDGGGVVHVGTMLVPVVIKSQEQLDGGM